MAVTKQILDSLEAPQVLRLPKQRQLVVYSTGTTENGDLHF